MHDPDPQPHVEEEVSYNDEAQENVDNDVHPDAEEEESAEFDLNKT